MHKYKILFCTESSHIISGFGNYTRSIISRLFDAGYEVAELSCYRVPSRPKTEKWKIYPAALPKDHPNYKEYVQDDSNQFGKFIFNFVLLDYKPDIVIDFRDFWMFAYQEISPLRPFYHWIIAPTFDSYPLLLDTLINFSNADLVLTHTEWANNMLKQLDNNSNLNIGGVISDAVDTNVFKPITYSKQEHKQKYGLPENSFIIGSVLRNQKRKLIPELFEILQKLLSKQTNQNILLYLHTSYPEINGWNIPELLLEYNITNNVLFTYKCPKCSHFMVNKYHGQKTICSNCLSTATMASVTNGVTDDELSDIYNIFDIYIQYAICEGFGIPQVEAVACGLPMITIDYGAMQDIGTNLDGYLVPVQKRFREQETNSNRVYPNNDYAINIIEELLSKSSEQRMNIGISGRNKLVNKYTWDITANNLKTIIDNIQLSGLQGKWDSPKRTHKEINTINYDGDNEKFITNIVCDIIRDEYLMSTSYIKNLIQNLDNGFIYNNNKIIQFTAENAMKGLEVYLQQKIFLEKIRVGESNIPEVLSTIINYSS